MPRNIWIPRETWLSGLPARTRKAIEDAQKGVDPGPRAEVYLRRAYDRAAIGNRPGILKDAPGRMHPHDQAAVALELLRWSAEAARLHAAAQA